MLRVRQRSDQARLLDDRDRAAALELCAADPVANVFVESTDQGHSGSIRAGSAPRCGASSRAAGWCRSATRGANLVPVQATPAGGRRVRGPGAAPGTALLVASSGRPRRSSELWGLLRPYWGPARDVRAAQPLMAIDGPSAGRAPTRGQPGPAR